MQAKRLLDAGHTTMGIALVTCVIGVLIAYVFYDYFSLLQQILAHIVLIVSPAALKIGYLMRLTGLHQLGMAVN